MVHLPRRFHLKLGNGWEALFPAGVPFYWEMLWVTAVWWQPDRSQVTPRRKILSPCQHGNCGLPGLFCTNFKWGEAIDAPFSANSEAINHLTLLPHSAGKCNRPRKPTPRQRLKTLSHLRSCLFLLKHLHTPLLKDSDSTVSNSTMLGKVPEHGACQRKRLHPLT